MNDKVNDTNLAEYLTEMAKCQGGASCINVKDGTVFYFERHMLMNLLDQCDKSGQDKVVILIKHNKNQT